MTQISVMFLILPLSFLAIGLLVNTFLKVHDGRLCFLLALVSANLYIVFLVELLSLMNLLTSTMVLIAWFMPILSLGTCLLMPGFRERMMFPKLSFALWTWYDWSLFSIIVIVLLIIGITAFFAPPNTADVLNYHMPRVMHWIQNQSVRHYPSGIEIQNTYPPASEYQVLQLVLLSGSDQMVNFAAWFMLLASAVCASYLTALLGVGKTGQLLSAFFIITMPIAILQASSVKNDIHVAFWTLLVLTLSLVYFQKQASRPLLVFIFAAIGLGFLTKANTIIFLIPILVWFAIIFVKQNGVVKAFQWGLIALLVFSILNAGFLSRNYQTFGNLMDANQSAHLMNETITPKFIFSNLMRNTIFHVQFPWPEVRQSIQLFILKVHVKLGLDINDPRVTSDGYFAVKGVNTNENLTGNTVHAWLMIVIILIHGIWLSKKKKNSSQVWLLLIFAASGYVLFSSIIKWQVFGARYFLPTFFLVAPIFGFVLSAIKDRVSVLSLILAMVIASWPWLFAAESRPILSRSAYANYPSILTTDRMVLLLGGDQTGFPGIYQLPDIVEETQCHAIGIYGGGGTTEYHIWAMLDSPRDDLRLEWIIAGTPSAAYIDPNFEPCLIVCYQCQHDLTQNKGLKPIVNGNIFDIYGANQGIE
jgi:4-amino-4-deoxy-L-arabinose transferase-like glycosyltransferase